MKTATFDQYLQFGQMVSKGAVSRSLMQALLEGRVIVNNEVKPAAQTVARLNELITVPNISADALIRRVQKKFGHRHVDENLTTWDFIRNERGKTYEVQVWMPGREVVPATEVRSHFTDGFVGNVAAFVAWVLENNSDGWFASIPEDADCFHNGDHFCAPHHIREGVLHDLRLYIDISTGAWNCGEPDNVWTYVAFREVK